MSLLQTVKDKLIEARRSANAVHLGVLQVVLGEVSTAEARSGKTPGDDEVEKIIRKVILGNQETLGHLEQRGQAGGDNHAKLTAENQLLATLLPKTMSVDEIVAALAEVKDAIAGAKND